MYKGDRVMTPGGLGSVAFVRNAPPNYSSPEAVSVVLDSKKGLPSYTGTMYAAREVFLANVDAE